MAIVAAVVAFLAIAAPNAVESGDTSALRQTLGGTSDTMLATAAWQPPVDPAHAVTAATISSTSAALTSALAASLPLVPNGAWSGVASATFRNLIGTSDTAPSQDAWRSAEIAYRSDWAGHVRVVSGHLPDAYGYQTVAGQTVVELDVAVSTATAGRFGVRVGSVLTIGPGPNAPAAALSNPPAAEVLKVVGVVAPAGDTSSSYWASDGLMTAPNEVHPQLAPPYWQGAALIGPDELSGAALAYAHTNLSITWGQTLDPSGVTAATAPTLLSTLTKVTDGDLAQQLGASYPDGISLQSPLITVLTGYVADQHAADQVVSLIIVGVVVIGLALALLTTRLVIERRRVELALLRARGASLPGLALHMAADSVTWVGAGVALAGVVALFVFPHDRVTQGWELYGVAAVIALAGAPLGAALSQAGRRRTIVEAATARQDLTRRQRSPRRLVAEATVVAGAVGAVFALRHEGAGQGSGVDPVGSAGPVLIALVAALVAIRCYPLPLRLALRVAHRRAGAAGYVGLARAARATRVAVLPALVLVLAMGIGSLGGMIFATISRAAVDASWRQAGADATITSPSDTSIPSSTLAAIAAVPGVRHVAAVAVRNDAAILVAGMTYQVTAVAVDPVTYAALVADTPWSRVASDALAATGSGPLPVLLSPGLAAAGAVGSVVTDMTEPQRIRVAGVLATTPAVTGAFVIVPPAAETGGPWPANQVLVTGAGLNAAAMRSTVGRLLPGAPLTLRSDVLAGLTDTPTRRLMTLVFEACIVVSAVLCAAAVVLDSALSARSRLRTLSFMTTLGLTPRQGRWLAAAETLPLLAVSLVGGVIAAVVLPRVVGSALNLSAFTGDGGGVSLVLDPTSLTLALGGVVVVVIVTITAQTAFAAGRGLTSSLRIGGES